MMTLVATRTTLTDMNWAEGVTGRLAGVTEISDYLGISRARADQLTRQQGFPKPYDVLAANTPRPQRVWLMRDIVKWGEDNMQVGTRRGDVVIRQPKEKA